MISDERLEQLSEIETSMGTTGEMMSIAKELLALRKGPEIPEGWKLVPVEPTPEMRLASRRYVAKTKLTTGPGFYRAMLAAAPEVE